MTTENKTWLITDTNHEIDLDIAKTALTTNHNVITTNHNPDTVAKAIDDSDDLLAVQLDVTNAQDTKTTVKTTMNRFNNLDVLINNTTSFYTNFFEKLTPEQMDRQITTTLIGPMNVTHTVLPIMRRQQSKHVVTISSSAGFTNFAYSTTYTTSKFNVDNWIESLTPKIEPFGIHTTIVNPKFFHTKLLTKESTNYAATTIEDYTKSNATQRKFWESQNNQQNNDPTKLAQTLLTITDQAQPPLRFIANADTLAQAKQKLAEHQQQIDTYRKLSSSLALDEVTA